MKTLNQFLEQGEPTQVDPKVKQAEKKENMLKIFLIKNQI